MAALSLLLVAMLAAGCAHSGKDTHLAVEPMPQPPVFLSGPMALLLTNMGGFRAQVVLEDGNPARQVAAGELMGRAGSLVFAPAFNKADAKRGYASSSAFIWDVSGNRGFILNDPMQAYAPASSSRQFTNLTVRTAASPAAPEKIAGHPCQPLEATVTAGDGGITAFRLWRATDLNGLPLRITCISSGAPLTLTLSKARLEALPDDLFLPPTGFAKFDSAESLIAELTARQYNVKRRPSYQAIESEPGMGPDTRTPTRIR